MANEKNLNPVKSKSEARERGRKGGINSGIAKRKRKTLKEELLLLLESEEIQQKISTALINEAINGNNAGSVTKAFEVIRDTIGEKPIDKVMVSDVDANVINEVERMVNDDEETSS